MAIIAAALALVLSNTGCACASGRTMVRPYPEPSVQTVLDHLARQHQQARSFQAESVMDYWVGKNRVKGTVLLMGEKGARVRFNALSPTGDTVAVDLACDGASFALIDSMDNCQLTGPCSRDTIAQLLRVSLEPDDFLLLVMGTTPLIPVAGAKMAWDPRSGREIVTIDGGQSGLTQTIALDGREGRWDVLSSVVRDGGGQVLWSLENKDFRAVTGEDGAVFRVPDRTQFKQPQNRADLLVRWRARTLNLDLDPTRFVIDVPEGLPRC